VNVVLSSLTPYTTYHYRVVGINGAGTTYGSDLTFTTSAVIPAVTTQPATSISATDATGNGNILNLGVPHASAYGIVWNTTGLPTIADNATDEGTASGTGAFVSTVTGLSANTTYYLRAYATNEAGTSYGNVVSFTTAVATLVSQETRGQMRLFPNPATNGFTIEAGEVPALLQIITLTGKVELTQRVVNKAYVDISKIATGTYIVSLNGKHCKLVKK